jgi:hypothetical protein
VYPYFDEQGVTLFEVLRGLRDGKRSFAQRQPNGTPSIDGVRRVLYNMPVWYGKVEGLAICEGEKDVETLRALDLLATTNMGGAGNWRPEYVEQLKQGGIKRVSIFVDNDEAGRKHAYAVARACYEAGIEVRVVMLPGLPEKGDVTDWLDASHGKKELLAFVKTVKVYTPADEPTEEDRFARVVKIDDAELFPGDDDEEINTIEWDWEGMVATGSTASFLGAKKAAKSWLQCLLLVSVTQPEPLFPGLPHGGKKAMLISGPGENNKREMKRRIRAIRRQHGILKREPGDGEIWAMEYRTAILRNEKETSALEILLADVRDFQPTHIFLDSASALWGGNNENDNAEVRRWVEQRLVPLIQAAAPDCTVYLAAHTGHVTRIGGKVFTPEHQRGASAWGDATDTGIMVEAVDPPAGSPEGTVAALVWQKFTRRGEPNREQFLLTITGGPRSKTPVEVKLVPFDQQQSAKPGAPHPTRLNAYGDAHQLVKEAGEAGIFKTALYDALRVKGHTETVSWNAIRTLEGIAEHPHPSGVYAGHVVRLVVIESRVNPKSKRKAAWLAYLPQDQMPTLSEAGPVEPVVPGTAQGALPLDGAPQWNAAVARVTQGRRP